MGRPEKSHIGFLPGVRDSLVTLADVKLESKSLTLERKLYTREKVLAILNYKLDINDIREK